MVNHKSIVSFFFLLVLLTASQKTMASIIVGSNSLTDTNTNLEWLFLNETTGMSYNDVIASVNNNVFSGFRIATFEEVWTLLDATGGDGMYLDSNAGAQPFATLIQHWGLGAQYSGPGSIWFHVLDVSMAGYTSGSILDINGSYSQHPDGFSTASTKYSAIGTALVKNSIQSPVTVSAPSTLAIFALGLLALVSRQFKKQ